MVAEAALCDSRPVPPRVEVSLVHEVLQAMSVTMMSSTWDGFEPWVYEAAARLDRFVRNDIEAVHAVLWNHRILERMAPGYDFGRGFDSFIAEAEAAPPEEYHAMVDCPLRLLARSAAAGCTHQTRADRLMRYLALQGVEVDEETVPRILRVLDDAEEMKVSFLRAVKGFWSAHFEQRYIECLPALSASASAMRNRPLPSKFADLLEVITGGLVPRDIPRPNPQTEIILTPSCHLGPYVTRSPLMHPWPAVVLSYNARRIGTNGDQPLRRPDNVVAALRAVADETRYRILGLLDGRELSVPEIVDRGTAGHAEIKRHLRLLAAEGFVRVRLDSGVKRYTLNRERLGDLARSLSSLS